MSWLTGRTRSEMVTPGAALPGRADYAYPLARVHAVLGTDLLGPWPAEAARIYLAMGCFWGAEKRLWRLDGVITTAVGYMGGFTSYPTYEEVCTGRTGHAEAVLVVYDAQRLPTYDVLKVFWENHDPTQGYRQGNDIGTQYRSAAFWSDPEQERLIRTTRDSYDEQLQARGIGSVTTELAPAEGRPFYYAEDYHQQYLYRNPHGYDCHSLTGIDLPPLA